MQSYFIFDCDCDCAHLVMAGLHAGGRAVRSGVEVLATRGVAGDAQRQDKTPGERSGHIVINLEDNNRKVISRYPGDPSTKAV